MTEKMLLRFSKVCCLIFALSVTHSYALESSLQLHKVGQEKSYGYSLSVGGEIFDQKAFNWQVNYNQFENVQISELDKISDVWDQADFDFRIQTLDLALGYRYYPRSYDKLINSLMFEFQVGTSVNLSEHKLVFDPEEVVRDDIYVAKQGDLNPVISISMQKSFTRKFAVHLGLKHYPNFSEFGSFNTVYLGFNYRFGRQIYY